MYPQHNMEVIKLHGQIPELKGLPGCIRIEWYGNELTITHIVDPVSRRQLSIDPSTQGTKIGLYTQGNVMTLAMKMGNLPWVDTCFHPVHCGYDGEVPPDYVDGLGMMFVNLFVDSSDGTVFHMHTFALSSEFTNSFLADCRRLMENPVSHIAYLMEVRNLQASFSSREIGTKRKQISFTLK